MQVRQGGRPQGRGKCPSALVTFHLFEVNFKQMSTWTCRPNDMRSSVPSHASLYLRATPTPSTRPTMVCFRMRCTCFQVSLRYRVGQSIRIAAC